MHLGAFTPVTIEGNILVDGVLASCYAGVNHDLAHIAMKPLLWFPRMMDLLLGGEEKFMHAYASMLEKIGKFIIPY